ncbi:MAG: DUF3795 domain-containing protein [Anaerolineales bacterium]|nr:DUF3795 domain-containing protein [Anaerolineales bacterium]
MNVPPEVIAPCGLYCGVCRIYLATQEDDRALLGRLAKIYSRRLAGFDNLTVDDMLCDGCLSERRFAFCRECSIRACTNERRYDGCHQCDDFPCALIHEFPTPIGMKVILRAIPFRRIHGTEKWIQAEEERYHCPECGEKLFRGASECNHCRSLVSLD